MHLQMNKKLTCICMVRCIHIYVMQDFDVSIHEHDNGRKTIEFLSTIKRAHV